MKPNKPIVFIIISFALSCLCGCNTIEPRLVHTTSGKPEVIIDAPVSAIKGAIISDMINHGYTVDADNNYLLRLSRPLKTGENISASIGAGNAYSSNRRITLYTFVPDRLEIRVVVDAFYEAQMPGGQVNRIDLISHGNTFNTFIEQLRTIKQRLEVTPAAAPKT